MARNRVIYQSEALFVSKDITSSLVGDHKQLARIQSANYNFNITRQDINQFGELARIDSLVLQSPTVALDLTYYPTDGLNERILGFYVRKQNDTDVANFASGHMQASSGQNIYIVTTDEGEDLNKLDSFAEDLHGKSVIGIGNAFLTNYTLDLSVGNIPTASVSLEGLNINSSIVSGYLTGKYVSGEQEYDQVTTGVLTPSINPTAGTARAYLYDTGDGLKNLQAGVVQLPNPSSKTNSGYDIKALRPGDVTITFGDFQATGLDKATPLSNLASGADGVLGSNAFHIQSASISLPLSRTPIERLGSRFAFTRVVDFPIVATLNVSAIVNEVQAKNLADMLDDSTENTITLDIKNNSSDSKGSFPLAMKFEFKGARLTSESFSSSIGANKTVDLVFETQIGGPNDSAKGIFVSGASIQTAF